MQIRFGSIVTDGRGKLGGHVYARNRGGSYVRTLTVPNNPQTSAQMSQRGLFAQITSSWSDLTDVQREAWKDFSDLHPQTNKVGQQIILSGKAMFQKVNLNVQQLGAGIITTPFVGGLGDPATVLEFEFQQPTTAGELFQLAYDVQVGDELGFVIEMTPPVSPGTSYVKNLYRVLSVGNGLNPTATISQSEYEAVFGVIQTGQKVYARISSVNEQGFKLIQDQIEAIMQEPTA